MQPAASSPAEHALVEFDQRPSMCTVPGCTGLLVRHSLGGGQSDIRCIRCFRRYRPRTSAAEAPTAGRLRRMLDEFTSWRE